MRRPEIAPAIHLLWDAFWPPRGHPLRAARL